MTTYPDIFERYWLTTAKRNGARLGKRATFREWDKLVRSGVEPEVLERASRAYTRHVEKHDTLAKDPERFLRQGLWEDFSEVEEPVEHVRTSKDIAQEYWREKGMEFALKQLQSEFPPDWVFRVPEDWLRGRAA